MTRLEQRILEAWETCRPGEDLCLLDVTGMTIHPHLLNAKWMRNAAKSLSNLCKYGRVKRIRVRGYGPGRRWIWRYRINS